MAHFCADEVSEIPGVSVVTPAPFFHEFAIRTPLPAVELNRALLARGVIGGYDVGRNYPDLADAVLLCCTEATTRRQVEQLVGAVREVLAATRDDGIHSSPGGSDPLAA